MLIGRAELPHRRGRDARVGAEPRADAAARPGGGHLFRPDRVVDVVAALAAQLLGVLEAEEAELGGPRIELARELARLVPLVHVGRDLGRDPARDRLAELLVLVREGRDERTRARVLDDGVAHQGRDCGRRPATATAREAAVPENAILFSP